jgi:hypothetical protein
MQDSPYTPIKAQELQPIAEGRKEVICTTRILQGISFPAYPSLRNTAGTPKEKTQNPNYKDTKD